VVIQSARECCIKCLNLVLSYSQPSRTQLIISRVKHLQQYDHAAGLAQEVFGLSHLPDRVFIIGPAATIEHLRSRAQISAIPVKIPSAEWRFGGQSSIFLPWATRSIAPGSWVRICKAGIRYRGDLGYVLGSSRTTDAMVIVALPRIYEARTEVLGSSRLKGKQKEADAGRRRRRALQAFFDPEATVARFGDVVKSFSITDGHDLPEVLTSKFPKRVTDGGLSKAFLDLANFDWVEGPRTRESLYLFKGQMFYRGLAILPIYGYGAVETVAVPPSEEVVAFAESHINPVKINSLLSQLYWQEGDRVRRADGIYQLADIQLQENCVSAFRLPTEPNPIAQLFPPNELRRTFFAGDGVIILAGLHKARTGSVLREENGLLHILITADDVVSELATLYIYSNLF
jgi:hypothetical protein